MDEPDRLELAEVIEGLRAELAQAHEKAANQAMQFPVEKLTVEMKVGVTKSTDGEVGFTVPVIGAKVGGSRGISHEDVQTVTLVLGPPVDAYGNPLKVGKTTSEPKD